MRNMIVAYDRHRGIGAANDMLWHRNLPADLQHFRKLTVGSTVIMGRKTYESIGKPLPGRLNIVISRSKEQIDGITVVENLESAYQKATTEQVFIIGGGQIYKMALDTVDRIFATEVDESFPIADVFFPELDVSKWREISREHRKKDERNKYNMDFVIYDRTSR